MKWSWRIGQVAGIGIYLHFTFLILLGWLALSHYLQGDDLWLAVKGMTFIILLFGIIVLHELGHALAAKRYGIKTRDITLLPIGGVARLERMPEDPKQELVVALAGPAVNVVLAGLFYLVVVLRGGLAPMGEIMETRGHLVDQLLAVNVALVVFNLIPAFPMDGGRVLRALLAMRMDYVQATQVAATIGQAIAFLFGLLGLVIPNPFLLFIAFFVWLGAAAEASMVQMKSALAGIPVQQAMVTDFRTLNPQETLGAAVDHILAGFQQDFPVLEDGRLVGILTRADLLSSLAKHGREAPISEVMQKEFETADPHEMLEGVFARLQECNCHTLPVVRNGQLIGLMTTDNLGEFLMIQTALKSHQQAT